MKEVSNTVKKSQQHRKLSKETKIFEKQNKKAQKH